MITFSPQPILFTLGPLAVRWYGLLIVVGMIGGIITAIKLAKSYGIDKNKIYDLAFWLIIFGVIGARLYDVALNFNYYLTNPLNVLKIWQGGLAIHGGIIAGLIVLYFFAKKNKLSFWLLASIIAPAVALGQAIGRWGNYFNQELFGLPTNLPWGIFISPEHRPAGYADFQYFQPTFFYESIGCLIIFLILIFFHKKKTRHRTSLLLVYLILYSTLRFFLEFIKIDPTPIVLSLRWPQWICLITITATVLFCFLYKFQSPHTGRQSRV